MVNKSQNLFWLLWMVSFSLYLTGCTSGWSEDEESSGSTSNISGSDESTKFVSVYIPPAVVSTSGSLSIEGGADLIDDSSASYVGLPPGVSSLSTSVNLSSNVELDELQAGKLVLTVPLNSESIDDYQDALSLQGSKSIGIMHHAKRRGLTQSMFGIRPLSVAVETTVDVDGSEQTALSFSIETGLGNHQIVMVNLSEITTSEKATDHPIIKTGQTYGALGEVDLPENSDLSPPGNLTASTANGIITISFELNNEALSYNLYVSTSSEVSKNDPKFEDITSPYEFSNDVVIGMAYYFVVTSINSAGESPISAVATVVAQ
jgi:hypothetical protein